MTKRFGFTLAEVLITLGIIGVVAAMTIPTLIANTNSAKFRSQFKKSISTLNQAGLMAQAQYDFDYAGASVVCADGAADVATTTASFCAILNGTLSGQTYYANPGTITRNNNGTSNNYSIVTGKVLLGADLSKYHSYVLADGSIVAFPAAAINCTLPIGTQLTDTVLGAGLKDCIGFIDVNGATLPNKEVTCKDNSATKQVQTPCIVPNDAAHMTDIYPIVFHDATVEPASDAAKFVLTSAK